MIGQDGTEFIGIIEALNTLTPKAEYIVVDGVITNWVDTVQTQPSESAITTEIARLQAEYDAQAYARNRKPEYPTIEECVHAILDDDLTALQVKRQAVKDKYPK